MARYQKHVGYVQDIFAAVEQTLQICCTKLCVVGVVNALGSGSQVVLPCSIYCRNGGKTKRMEIIVSVGRWISVSCRVLTRITVYSNLPRDMLMSLYIYKHAVDLNLAMLLKPTIE